MHGQNHIKKAVECSSFLLTMNALQVILITCLTKIFTLCKERDFVSYRWHKCENYIRNNSVLGFKNVKASERFRVLCYKAVHDLCTSYCYFGNRFRDRDWMRVAI